MKNISIIVISALYNLVAFSQPITLDEWNEQAKTNIRLLPNYGHVPKTEEQKSADKEFIEITLKQFSTKREASNHLIELGFNYLYKDVKTAMYRFNQAWLLDSSNTDIFWGYAGVYMTLGDYQRAKQQYTEGLSNNPKSTHLLTDYGTYFMAQYYALEPIDKKQAAEDLDSAVNYLATSYHLDAKDQNTTFKLSICYYQEKDCKNARKYYEECLLLGGKPITKEFTDALNERCKKTK